MSEAKNITEVEHVLYKQYKPEVRIFLQFLTILACRIIRASRKTCTLMGKLSTSECKKHSSLCTVGNCFMYNSITEVF